MMSPSSLHALIIDRHLGELPPEVVELLELHLAQNPDARLEAERILDAMAATQNAMMQHPELGRVGSVISTAASIPRAWTFTPWMSRAAAAVLLAAVVAGGLVLGGRSGSRPMVASAPPVATSPQAPPRKAAPWTRYRMAFDPSGNGMQVVRVNPASMTTTSPQ